MVLMNSPSKGDVSSDMDDFPHPLESNEGASSNQDFLFEIYKTQVHTSKFHQNFGIGRLLRLRNFAIHTKNCRNSLKVYPVDQSPSGPNAPCICMQYFVRYFFNIS